MLYISYLPNILTLLRLFFGPALIIFFLNLYVADKISTLFIFTVFFLIFITDFLDGFLARKLKAQSKLGSLIDGLADKAIIYAILIFYLPLGKITYLQFYLLLFRDLLVLSLKHYANECNINLKVVSSAKIKMFLECILAFSFLFQNSSSNIIMALVLISAWYSAIRYFLNFYSKLNMGAK